MHRTLRPWLAVFSCGLLAAWFAVPGSFANGSPKQDGPDKKRDPVDVVDRVDSADADDTFDAARDVIPTPPRKAAPADGVIAPPRPQDAFGSSAPKAARARVKDPFGPSVPRAAPPRRTRAQVAAAFDRDQSRFQEQINRLRQRLDRLEAKLEQRSRRRDELIRRSLSGASRAPAVRDLDAVISIAPRPGPEPTRPQPAGRPIPGPLVEGESSLPTPSLPQPAPAVGNGIPPNLPADDFAPQVPGASDPSQFGDSPNISSASVDPVAKSLIDRCRANTAALRLLSNSQSQTGEAVTRRQQLLAEQTLVLEQLTAQRKVLTLRIRGLKDQVANVQRSGKSLKDAGMSDAAALRRIRSLAETIQSKIAAHTELLEAVKELAPATATDLLDEAADRADSAAGADNGNTRTATESIVDFINSGSVGRKPDTKDNQDSGSGAAAGRSTTRPDKGSGE